MRIYQLIGMACLGLLASNSTAQGEKPLERKTVITYSSPCYDTKKLFASLRNDYKELPFLYAKAEDVAKSTVSIWLHPTHKTFTFVATVDDTSCVIGTGNSLQVVPKETAQSK